MREVVLGLFALGTLWVGGGVLCKVSLSNPLVFWINTFRGFKISLTCDFVSVLFRVVLLSIVFCVLNFRKVYMGGDFLKSRFRQIVLSFVISMLILIFSSDFLFLLVGWDGLGVTRFLLIAYYNSSDSWAASLKTFLKNRWGDGCLILGLSLLLLKQGGFFINGLDCSVGGFFVLLLLMGGFTKRAQFPFSSWLPSAMAAPTPVSALVHSSTLVTAGVYLIFRKFRMVGGGVGAWGGRFMDCINC